MSIRPASPLPAHVRIRVLAAVNRGAARTWPVSLSVTTPSRAPC